MDFMCFMDPERGPLRMGISKKRRKWATAVVNRQSNGWWLLHRPDLWQRYRRVMEAREARAVRRYSPHDPNRIPK